VPEALGLPEAGAAIASASATGPIAASLLPRGRRGMNEHLRCPSFLTPVALVFSRAAGLVDPPLASRGRVEPRAERTVSTRNGRAQNRFRRAPVRPRLGPFELRAEGEQARLAGRAADELHAERQPVLALEQRQ